VRAATSEEYQRFGERCPEGERMNVNHMMKVIRKDFMDHPVECSTTRRFYWNGYIAALPDTSQITEE
jgi:hypothetical protein